MSKPMLICDTDPAMLPAAEAIARINGLVDPVTAIESVAVRSALGRILAQDLISRDDIPNHTNSAMDGYALASVDLNGQQRHLNVIGTALAGKPFDGMVEAGQCVRIMTGAVMPKGTDSVVIQENVTRTGDTAVIDGNEQPKANVRYAGEDLQAGAVAMQKGTCIKPVHLGLAASLGYAEMPVFRRPRVAFFSNGDELKAVGSQLQVGELYDSNRYTLFGMLSEMGVDLIDLGVVADDPQAIRQTLLTAAKNADVVITSAGASVGEADYIKSILDEIGEVAFWKVAIKPGRPLSFGKIGDAMFFGLPGNPVSVMVTFDIFVKRALSRLRGDAHPDALRIKVPCAGSLKKRPGRTEYQRGILSQDAHGNFSVTSTGAQGSGILSSMGKANCFIILEEDNAGVSAGELVAVEPF